MTATTFGAYVAKLRKEKGISQKDLASLIMREEDGKPISPQYLNDIERDRRNPTADHTIRQFATVLDADPDYLFYLAGTLPADVRSLNVAPETVARAFKAFRKSAG